MELEPTQLSEETSFSPPEKPKFRWDLILRVFWQSYLKVTRECRSLAFLFLQPILLASCIFLSQNIIRATATSWEGLHFFLPLAAFWLGMNSSVREVVSTTATTAIDHIAGLKATPWFLGKILTGAVEAIVAGIVLTLTTWAWIWSAGGPISEPPGFFFERSFGLSVIYLTLTAISGLAIGFIISAMAQTERQAVTTMPAVLLPLVLFSDSATRARNNSQGDPYLAWGESDFSLGWPQTFTESVNQWMGFLSPTQNAAHGLAAAKTTLCAKPGILLIGLVLFHLVLAFMAISNHHRLNIRKI